MVSTSIKSGTTWMQWIVLNLLFQDSDTPPPTPVAEVSPWLDFRLAPLDEVIDLLEAQRHRRVIKAHVPLDGLPYHQEVSYVVVVRDARDVFMSLWNHYRNFSPEVRVKLNSGQVGAPLPACPDDIRAFWRVWITRGWFDWESEGYPYWGNLHHTSTWWEYRHLSNVLLVHFNDLLVDPAAEIQRVARHIGTPVSDQSLADIVAATSFARMKREAERFAPSAGRIFLGGAQTFFERGVNGRWREVLTAEDLELYEAALERVLSAECANWLEKGRAGEAADRWIPP